MVSARKSLPAKAASTREATTGNKRGTSTRTVTTTYTRVSLDDHIWLGIINRKMSSHPYILIQLVGVVKLLSRWLVFMMWIWPSSYHTTVMLDPPHLMFVYKPRTNFVRERFYRKVLLMHVLIFSRTCPAQNLVRCSQGSPSQHPNVWRSPRLGEEGVKRDAVSQIVSQKVYQQCGCLASFGLPVARSLFWSWWLRWLLCVSLLCLKSRSTHCWNKFGWIFRIWTF